MIAILLYITLVGMIFPIQCCNAFYIGQSGNRRIRSVHDITAIDPIRPLHNQMIHYSIMQQPESVSSSLLPYFEQQLHRRRRQKQQQQQKYTLRAIHEPSSDSESSSTTNSISQVVSSFYKSYILDRYRLASIIKNGIVIGLSSYYFYKGLFSISNIVTFWKFEGDMTLYASSVAAWCGELIGLITLSKSMLYFLTGVTRMSPLQCSALSGLPCVLYLLRGIISHSFERVGFNQFFAPLVIFYATLINILTFTNIVPPEKLKKYLYMPLMATGIITWLLPQISASVVGIELKTAMDKVLWIFLGRGIISTSTLIYSLSFGKLELAKAMRNMTASTAATTILDVLFIRRNILLAAGFSIEKAYRFILVSLSASGILFLLP